jgi:hypothetical protein
VVSGFSGAAALFVVPLAYHPSLNDNPELFIKDAGRLA